ncbi:MAG: hypothetical protein HOP19_07280 [Acidobacteria bacterium]|nr:hypothetical protein [Acidobacteriota bacterium]
MNKAKLIKRDQITEVIQPRKTPIKTKPVVRKTMEAVNNWMDSRRNQRVDPRAAFAALFIQPQEQ